jgi:TRAP-type C4-dicarboxylate transport system substrate-binding protein
MKGKYMKLLRLLLVSSVVLFGLTATTSAQRRIGLASVVPDGSIWDKNLKQMAAEWNKLTGQRVVVHANGTQGDEPTIVRKMNLGTLQAAALTIIGLSDIDPSFNVFSIPFFFDSYDELNYVIEKLEPTFRKRLEDKGFVLLNWGHGGWVQIFSKQAIHTLVDLKSAKLYTSAGDPRMADWYRNNGFTPRALSVTDVLPSLSTGIIDAMPSSPLGALLFQWYRQTPFMLEVGIAPLVGATVFSARTWNGIPEADRASLTRLADGVETRLKAEVPGQDASAVAAMSKRGLTVIQASQAQWRADVQGLAAAMRGAMVPNDIFDMASRARDAYRSGTR